MPTNDLLSEDHSDVDRLFAKAFAALEQNKDAFATIDLIWARLAVHIRAEHLHLFPTLSEIARQNGDSRILETIALLHTDHDFFMKQLASIIKELRRNPSANVKDPLAEIAVRLEQHNAIEEDSIYPLINNWLTPLDKQTLIAHIATQLNNPPARFADTTWR